LGGFLTYVPRFRSGNLKPRIRDRRSRIRDWHIHQQGPRRRPPLLKRLIENVHGGKADFSTILVCDVILP